MQEEGKKTFKLFNTYPICHYSGGLGPKLKEGDLQAPEGFYSVTKDKLNPNSRFHLSFNLGFPNALERFRFKNYSSFDARFTFRNDER